MFKEAVSLALVFATAVTLFVIYFVQYSNSPAFVSPETAEYITLNKGHAQEVAESVRTMCEENGCYFGDDGSILANTPN